MSESPPPGAAGTAPAAVLDQLRNRSYLLLLLLAAVIGAPISALAWGFLWLIQKSQHVFYTDLWHWLGFHGEPLWWPVPLLMVGGFLVALSIHYLPGTSGHRPAEGFSAGQTQPVDLFGVVLAALAGLTAGVVLGPEAPLLALGSGLGLFAIRRARRGGPPTAELVLAAAGSVAALGTVLGSPIVAIVILVEAVGIGGTTLTVLLLPGMLAAGVGALVFIGLGAWSGVGTLSLALPDLPTFPRPTVADLGWALALAVFIPFIAAVVRFVSLRVLRLVTPRQLWALPLAGLVVALLALAFHGMTGQPSSAVLFSGQFALGPLVAQAGTLSVGTLVALVACKALAYGVSLGSFRGGPIFPSLLLGAAVGLAVTHLPGLSLVPGIAIGMGAFAVCMLRLPISAILLATLLLGRDGVTAEPVVIIAVVVSLVVMERISPRTLPADLPPA